MTIVAGSLYRDSWKTVFSVVNSSFTLGSVYSAFPETYKGRPLTFPMAVVDNTDNSQSRVTFTGTGIQSSDLSFPVTIYTRSRAQLDQGADYIKKGISSNISTLLASGLHTWTIRDETQGTEIYGDEQKMHFKTIVLGANWSG